MSKNKIIPKGIVISKQSKQPIENLHIEVWDNNMAINESLGRAVTDAIGKFEVIFDKRFEKIIDDMKHFLYFKVFRNDKLVADTRDSTTWTAALPEDVIIEVFGEVEEKKPDDGGGKPPDDDGGKKPIDDGGKKPIDYGGKKPIDDGGKKPIDDGGKKPLIDDGKKPPVENENNLQPWVISHLKRK